MPADPLRVKQLFVMALDIADRGERDAFLARECKDDHELRSRLSLLLDAHDHPQSALERPLAAPAATATFAPDEPTADHTPPEIAGTLVAGRYKLLERIGEGGMGEVWVAEQTEPIKRRVALKLIKPGMDSRAVLARFEAERQALALMDHPNIARVLDAGYTGDRSREAGDRNPESGGQVSSLTPDTRFPTPDPGRPYFVMELVKGTPITAFCDERKLSPRERLELFVPVCQAIQHAHQKGIIHRDIKPSNVLVALHDEKAVPKVIDFGVAKAIGQQLTEKTLYTGFGSLVGTPAYMAPEQATFNQLDVDTRADVYALGVLLYELLAGSPPFEPERLKKAALDEVLRLVREEEPPRPSARLSTSETRASIAAVRQSEPTRLSKLLRGELDCVVMKALEKDRNRRYETANGFAADVQRYLAGEAVQACPPSAGYRLRKFARRNKGRLVVASVLALAALVATSGIGWAVRDRAARQAEAEHELRNRRTRLTARVNSILADVERLQQEQKWSEALAAARRAEAAFADGEVDAEAQLRLRTLLNEVKFVERLDRIEEDRTARIMFGSEENNYRQAADEYAIAFRDYGTDVEQLPVEEAIARLKNQPALCTRLATAFDNWDISLRIGYGFPNRRAQSVARIAREIDTDPLRRRIHACRAQQLSPGARVKEYRRLAEDINARTATPQALIMLALELGRVGEHDDAVRVLRAARTAHPDDFRLNIELGRNLKNDPEAGRYFASAIALRPDSRYALYLMGGWLNRNGTPQEAAECFHRLLELSPDSVVAHIGLGHAQLRLKLFDAAAASFRRANELTGVHLSGSDGLGSLFLALKKPAEAIPHLRIAVRETTSNSFLYERLAQTLEQTNQFAEAMEARREGVRRNSTDARYPNAYEYLARALERDGKVDEALQVRSDAVRKTPTAGAIRALAMMHGASGQWDKAAAEYDRAIELDPTDSHGRYMAAIAHVGAGQFDQYKRVCRELIARCAQSSRTVDAERTAIACLLFPDKLDSTDLAQVQQLADRAVADGMKYVDFRFGARAKGLADYRAGQYAEAVRRLRQYSPDGTGQHQDVIAYAILAMAQYRLGKIEDARTALSQAQVILKTKRPDPKRNRPYQPGQSHGWLYSEILFREAEALVLKKN